MKPPAGSSTPTWRRSTTATQVPSIRAQQASELVAPGGPATSKLPVILLGDLNSDVKTEVQLGDGQAYRVITGAGFRERATGKPTGCCIDSSYDLKTGEQGRSTTRSTT